MSASYNTPQEDALIKRAAEGDRDAFECILRTYEKMVYSSVKSRIGNDDDALDISQEVFIKIWRYIATYRGDCRFATWVYRICGNACMDFLRHEKASAASPMPTYIDKDGEELTIEPADESESSSPEDTTVRREIADKVRQAIWRLTPEQREVIMLRDIEGYGYEEIASMLGLGMGTVKSRINRARLHLKELLYDVYIPGQ